MNNFIIGTFFTSDTPYEKVFNEYALSSLMRAKAEWDIDWRVVVKPNLGSWQKNVAQKPKAIAEILDTMMFNNDSRNLVFIDADTTILSNPALFNELDCDIAYHKLDWSTWYNRPEDITKELLTGTMFFRNNRIVRELCIEWYEKSINTDIWEQKVLEKLLCEFSYASTLIPYILPIDYCYIQSMPNGQEPFVKINFPVILHHQLSRKLKRLIK